MCLRPSIIGDGASRTMSCRGLVDSWGASRSTHTSLVPILRRELLLFPLWQTHGRLYSWESEGSSCAQRDRFWEGLDVHRARGRCEERPQGAPSHVLSLRLNIRAVFEVFLGTREMGRIWHASSCVEKPSDIRNSNEGIAACPYGHRRSMSSPALAEYQSGLMIGANLH